MSGRFEGKVVLVAGGGVIGPDGLALGIGTAICQIFAKEGASVAVLDIDARNTERTLARVRKDGGRAFGITADVAIDADCARAVQETVARYGRLDVLVNNVGTGMTPGLASDSEEAFDRLMAVNFKGEFLLAKHSVPHLPRGGSIVNLGSVDGTVDVRAYAYSISKRAVSMAATPALAFRYAPQGIRVNCVTVGYVWNALTEAVLNRQAPGQSVEDYRRGRAETLNALQIEGDARDAAEAVAFLASDAARWITGQDLVVDGGYSLMNVFDMTPYGSNLIASARTSS